MDWLIEPFALGFQQRALMGAALAAVLLAIVGTWVVIRGMSFLGDALVHGVIPGIAAALIFGGNVLIGAAVAAIVMLFGIDYIHRKSTFSEDTGIGLLFVGMLALGVVLISRTESYAGNLTAVLFGDVLAVQTSDIALLAVITVLTLGSAFVLHRAFLALSFNEQKARVLGLSPGLAHFALLGLITIAIIGSFQTVGTLLVFGLLIGPPATAALLVRRVPAMMALASGIGALSAAVGLVISYHADTAGSATVAAVSIALFFVVLVSRGSRSTGPQTQS